MNKDVKVKVTGMQFSPDSEMDSVTTEAIGTYYKKKDTHYILYEEAFDASKKLIKNRIKCKEDSLQLHKQGPLQTDMIFEKIRRNVAKYRTPYGDMHIGIETKRVDIKEEEQRIEIKVDYAMDVDGAHLADCNIQIEIESL